MEARIEAEASMFETSHVLGSLLASSSILSQAWHHCSAADTGAAAYVRGSCGNTVYVAFSSKYVANSLAGIRAGPMKAFDITELGGSGLFRPLVGGEGEEEEKVKVQALALHLFLTLLNSPNYQNLLQEIKDKPVIFTGHSLGGSLASLAALHFLCNSSSGSFSSCNSTPTPPLLCVTFGTPLLGNEAFSRAILRERLAGHFCHVVSQRDIVPRLLFCPLGPSLSILGAHMHCCNLLPDEERANLQKIVSMHIAAAATARKRESPYWPFGNYVLCSKEGAVCIDNPTAVVQLLYVTFVAGIEVVDLSYRDIAEAIPQHLLLKKRDITEEENFDGGISLVLEASGIGSTGIGAAAATEFKVSKRASRSPNLICAELATKLGKITPCRAQIEWYKVLSDDDMGYYDSFKQRISPKKYSKVNINRMKLGQFWDEVIEMLQNNSLPYDFHRRAKWVNAAQFYKLLVEPLDIAEYYRTEQHMIKGHYLTHGRERRYEVFDKWWKSKTDLMDNSFVKRSKFAGLTQDSCFWARVEQAKELTEKVKTEQDAQVLGKFWKDIVEFEDYAKDLVERKEVSIDVLAPRSSYRLWVDEWKSIKSARAFCFNG
ncbi:Lipase-like PAD4 [Rhynchospora pubera]|uniref:Lipase-like PAD4 n=1 Tax=Rhynchospora pubera TaxID=906938 RepID=A0AAV8CAA0_9POAL|nr:Lipase-like PAD4 [Rhynchospora pubera]